MLAIVMGILIKYWRNELVSWFILILFILKIRSIVHFSETEDVFYREFNYYLYSVIKVGAFAYFLFKLLS